MTDLKWDLRWLHLARFVASFSKDPSTKTGAVLVRPNNSVASIGYNGFPRRMQDNEKHYHDREEKYSRIVHCEINALNALEGETADALTLYTWPFISCDRCAIQMIQSGIRRAVAPIIAPETASRWAHSIARTRRYFEECSVEYLEIPFRTDLWNETSELPNDRT